MSRYHAKHSGNRPGGRHHGSAFERQFPPGPSLHPGPSFHPGPSVSQQSWPGHYQNTNSAGPALAVLPRPSPQARQSLPAQATTAALAVPQICYKYRVWLRKSGDHPIRLCTTRASPVSSDRCKSTKLNEAFCGAVGGGLAKIWREKSSRAYKLNTVYQVHGYTPPRDGDAEALCCVVDMVPDMESIEEIPPLREPVDYTLRTGAVKRLMQPLPAQARVLAHWSAMDTNSVQTWPDIPTLAKHWVELHIEKGYDGSVFRRWYGRDGQHDLNSHQMNDAWNKRKFAEKEPLVPLGGRGAFRVELWM